MTTAKRIYKSIENEKQRSAWNKGVAVYALELVEQLQEAIESGYFEEENISAPKMLKKALLNGAEDWNQYSWGGSALIYDTDIAERLCNPSELKRTKGGRLKPNSREQWLDTQARALYQACIMVMSHARKAVSNNV